MQVYFSVTFRCHNLYKRLDATYTNLIKRKLIIFQMLVPVEFSDFWFVDDFELGSMRVLGVSWCFKAIGGCRSLRRYRWLQGYPMIQRKSEFSKPSGNSDGIEKLRTSHRLMSDILETSSSSDDTADLWASWTSCRSLTSMIPQTLEFCHLLRDL